MQNFQENQVFNDFYLDCKHLKIRIHKISILRKHIKL